MIARSCIPCKEANSWACKSTLGFCPSIVAVPLFLEPKLLKLLNITPYSSKAKVTKAKGMELEGIPMKTRKFRSYGPLYD